MSESGRSASDTSSRSNTPQPNEAHDDFIEALCTVYFKLNHPWNAGPKWVQYRRETINDSLDLLLRLVGKAKEASAVGAGEQSDGIPIARPDDRNDGDGTP